MPESKKAPQIRFTANLVGESKSVTPHQLNQLLNKHEAVVVSAEGVVTPVVRIVDLPNGKRIFDVKPGGGV